MADLPTSLDRRRFLRVLGTAGAGTAALSGCSTSQVERLVPYLVQSEDVVPSLPTVYASTCAECPSGCGLHVKTREARAIKLEGNPDHPVNAGRLCARGQASLQGLYNPDRLRFPMGRNAAGQVTEILWNEATDRLARAVRQAGSRVAVLSGAGPGTFDDLLAEWVGAIGGRLVRYQPFAYEPIRLAHQRMFGRREVPAYDFAAARYIVSFGTDFLDTWLAPVENQRGFGASHGFNGSSIAKFVYVGPRMSLTAVNADEWVAPRPGSEASLALGMANAVLAGRADAPADAASLRAALAPYTVDRVASDTGLPPATVRRLCDELVARTPSLAVAGDIPMQHREAENLCAAVAVLNYVAGNVGRTVHFGAELATGDGHAALRDLERAMAAGEVDVLIVHDANPLYALPRSSGFRAAFDRVALTVSTALVLDETAAASDLLIPNLHALERWDDVRPRAGVRALLQPVMEPVYRNVSTGDVLLETARKAGGPLARFTAPTFEAHLRSAWADLARARGAADTDEFWRAALRRGGVFEPRPAVGVTLAAGAAAITAVPPAFDGDGPLLFAPYPSPMYYDGRGANRPWLLENPDPVTKITWQSWVEMHPDRARELDVRSGEIVRLTSPHGSIEAPVYVYAGIRPDTVAVPLGLGHEQYGRYASGRGVNAADLLPGEDGTGWVPYLSTRVTVEKTGRYQKPARTDGMPRELGRHIAESMPAAAAARGLTLEEAYREAGGEPHEINTEREVEAIEGFREEQLEAIELGEYAREHPLWGMTIDLSRCTGCSACVTACYAENNIPFVGEADVLRGREMSWMRIDRYFSGGEDGEPLRVEVIPVLCQHCANAPCEPVCPVYAAYHTPDGLNGQVYNRCVGTRYCGNNCPYKVRYFNWYAYAKRAFEAPLHLQLNPDVTVRARGVMEKCTFCVQRIRGAQNQARLGNRPLVDGEVMPACAQTCPSSAIVFGNVRDPASRVTASRRDPRGYRLLEDINTRPAITYLARVVDRPETDA